MIDVFVRGTDGALWERTTTNGGGSWCTWTSLGGQIASGTGPAASSSGAGRLDVFVEGTNGALYQKTWTGSWSGWQSLGGSLDLVTRRDVTGQRRDRRLCRAAPTAPSGKRLPRMEGARGATGPLSAARLLPAQDQRPARGAVVSTSLSKARTARCIKKRGPARGPTGPLSAGPLTSSPAATSPASGVFDVFVRGTDGALWETP